MTSARRISSDLPESLGEDGPSHAVLIAAAEAAASVEASRRFGPDPCDISGATERGCCVHLTIARNGQLLAHWRFELNGRITDDPRPKDHLTAG